MKKAILDYLKYLRDTSKNLSVNGNMYRSLFDRNNKKKPWVIEVDKKLFEGDVKYRNSLFNQFFTFADILKRDPDKRLFAGFGFICGKKTKKLYSSIINIPTNFTLNNDQTVTFELDYSLATINIDLISSILPDYFAEDDSVYTENLLNVLNATQEELNTITNTDQINEICERLIQSLNKEVPDVSIEILDDKIDHEIILHREKSPTNRNGLWYRSDRDYLFINTVPSNISTWKSLDVFCDKIANDEFEHPVLSKLFDSLFDQKVGYEQTSSSHFIDSAMKYIPTPLTDKQKAGIRNSFNYDVSYIQGPPGTGKSHTISAIILAAYLLNKKVLVVSQKPTALNVVKNNILKFFDNSLEIPFIYFDKGRKQELKNNINKFLDISKTLDFDIAREKSSILDKQHDIDSDILEEHNFDIRIKKILDLYSVFYEKNENLVKYKKDLTNNPVYVNIAPQKLKALLSENKEIVAQIKAIEDHFFKKGKIIKLHSLKLKHYEQQFNEAFESEISFIDILKLGILSIFLKDWFKLNNDLYDNKNIYIKLPSEENIAILRHRKKEMEKLLTKKKIALIKEKHKFNLYSKIQDRDIFINLENFKKMLHFERSDRVLSKMENIDYNKLFEIFPIWLSEIRNIGEILPNEREIFDLVVVDEASQVNLAEILPVFYRAKNVCILGDHKQLGLNSVGLNFSLSGKSDRILWNKYNPNNYSYDEAEQRNLTITKSSILELMRSELNSFSLPSLMLDQHWRSLPALINFSNRTYYDNSLKIMTETPDKKLATVCSAIKVDGVRENKINIVEAEEVIKVIRFIIQSKKLSDEDYQRYFEGIPFNDYIPETPSIGVISLIRDQVDYIKDLINENFSPDIIEQYNILCGTSEDFQGEEKDIMIYSFVTDSNSRNAGHYTNPNRFNVSVSRAKHYMILIYTDVKNIPTFKQYMNNLGILEQEELDGNIEGWSYDEDKLESEFERIVATEFIEFCDKVSAAMNLPKPIQYFNQVSACGTKRIDLVFFNPNNNKSVAIEVDGFYHFDVNTHNYSKEHIDRMDLLTKSGWKIINTPYFCWFNDGFIDKNYYRTKKEIMRIKKELLKNLDIRDENAE